ncbi:Rieske (2Fe-2S) protein [Dyella caseinilytica]|uniref:Non-heme iron oxygenase ferredoxin subunit n=1 Tax=Dyella caseinilytica TaxID=1849581 RepID=A0ABX7GSD7_9GAMM|nr:non-heme iron oxygenase ferredoxin subunit [Dyella caseinilytica]QRN53175.1 non-heme iron oxygenase ferredoxin subunit [Dyella caseinilytica]GGA12046.1 naphthalene 1,2-dioxygenase [Dyella caseinilytica]
MSWETICSRSQVREEYPFGVKVAGKEIGVFLVDGDYFAIENVCPHAYALLSQGFVEDGKVECPLHEAVFDIRSGRCLREPGGRDLLTYPLRLHGDDVQIDTAALQAKEEAAA